MTALDEARAAMVDYDEAEPSVKNYLAWGMPVYLRDLIAEHERLTADVEAIRRTVGAVIDDRKYGGDLDWVKMNLRPVARGTFPRPTPPALEAARESDRD